MMVARIKDLIRRFAGHSDGNFAILSGLAAVPLLLAMGGVVDLSILYSNRARLQNAADAAALAAARQFPSDPDPQRLAAHADRFFKENAGSLYRTTASLFYDGTRWTEDHARELQLHVEYEYDPIFLPVDLLDFDGVVGRPATIASAVMVADTTVEVAMVLDTSGSMLAAPSAGGDSKIVTLRTVAKDAAAKFFSSIGTGAEKPVAIAIVPFSGAVNVGPQYLDAPWMDPKGLSPIHHENFDWKTYTDARANPLATQKADKSWVLTKTPSVPLTRQYIYKNMKPGTLTKDTTLCDYKGVTYPLCSWSGSDGSWALKLAAVTICTETADPYCRPYKQTVAANAQAMHRFAGCVEARKDAFGINDATPDEATPDTLFVPYFAPDEPESSENSFLKDQNWEYPFGKNRYPLRKSTPLSTADFYAQQNSMNKYLLLPQKHRDVDDNNINSPNFICDSAPILPLSTDATQVVAKIEGLQAVGATNVDEGVGWGWRTLSPSAPFTEGRPKGDEKNIKAIILMTDGENTYYQDTAPNRSWFGSYGYSQIMENNSATGGRIFHQSGRSVGHTNSNFTLAMDGRTKKVCANAKNDSRIPLLNADGASLSDERGPVTRDGVIIYTIAFDIPATSASRVDALLTDCASYRLEDLRNTALPYAQKRKNFYRAKDAEELDTAFNDILASLSKMRVSR